MTRLSLTALAAFVLAAALAAPPAGAAPQVLGLMASHGPIPLTCGAEGCSARLAAFCLQQGRDVPTAGTVYRPAGSAGLTLVATLTGGEIRRLPRAAADRLRFTTEVGYTAVEVTLPAAELARLGAVASLALEVAPGLSLLPPVIAGDPEPQTEEELALATGPLRAAAARFFDAPTPQADAARLTGRLVNALPARGRDPSDTDGTLWERVVDAGTRTATAPEALAIAADLHRGCQVSVDTGHSFSLRRCLEGRLDGLLTRTNLRFWESVGGS